VQKNTLKPMAKKRKNVLLFAVLLLNSLIMASTLGVNIVLPQRMLDMDAMVFYPLATAIGTLGMMLVLPLIGKLIAVFGIKTITIFGILFQFATRVFLMFIISPIPFLFMYALSAVAVGIYIAVPFAMIAEIVEIEDRPKYYGMVVTFQAVGSLSGPVITGQLMDMGFQSLGFVSYLPFLIVATPIIMALYPKHRKTVQTAGEKTDLAGIFLLVISITCVIFYLSLGGQFFGWMSPVGIALIVVGIVRLILLIRIESKHPNPSVPIVMFKKKRFTVAFLSSMLAAAFMSVYGAYVIAYTQQIMQVPAIISSTCAIPLTITQAVFGAVTGRILGKKFAQRFRPVALTSLLLLFIATLLVCFLQPDSSMIIIYVASALGGIGTVVPQSNYTAFFQTELQPKEYSSAQGMFTFGSTGGSCIYIAISGALMNSGGTFNHSFILAAGFSAAALLIGIIGIHLPKEAPVGVEAAK